LYITKKNFRVPIFTFAVIGSLLFLLLIFIAMIIYTGGNLFDHYFPYYSFTMNYLSDLGREHTFLGEPNWAPRMLFSFALIIGGVGLIVFFLLYPFFFKEDKKTYRISLAGTVLGVISSLFCTITAFLPLDVFTIPHRACAYALGIAEVPAIILLAIAIFREKKFPNFYAWVFLVYISIMISYIALCFILGFDSPFTKEVVLIVGQKIVIFSQVLNLFIQAFGARKLLLSSAYVTSRVEITQALA